MLGCIQPMSSPMMKRMLGFFCSCPTACDAIVTAASAANRPTEIFLIVFSYVTLAGPVTCAQQISAHLTLLREGMKCH